MNPSVFATIVLFLASSVQAQNISPSFPNTNPAYVESLQVLDSELGGHYTLKFLTSRDPGVQYPRAFLAALAGEFDEKTWELPFSFAKIDQVTYEKKSATVIVKFTEYSEDGYQNGKKGTATLVMTFHKDEPDQVAFLKDELNVRIQRK